MVHWIYHRRKELSRERVIVVSFFICITKIGTHIPRMFVGLFVLVRCPMALVSYSCVVRGLSFFLSLFFYTSQTSCAEIE